MSIFRLLLVVGALTVAAAAGITPGGFLAVRAANACSTSSHCYGITIWSPSPAGHGAAMDINVSCLSTPTPSSNFITAEQWVGTNNDPSGAGRFGCRTCSRRSAMFELDPRTLHVLRTVVRRVEPDLRELGRVYTFPLR
jgi:hypothetical protein